MTRLEGKKFKHLYTAVFKTLPNPSRAPLPDSDTIELLYAGIGGVPGFRRFSLETFEELCGLAIQECKYMPAPEWFNDRAVALSAPGRSRALESLVIAPASEVADPEAQAKIQLMIREAEKSALEAVKQKEKRASDLIVEGICNPKFKDWIIQNQFSLRQRFRSISRRSGANEQRLFYLLQSERACQMAYLDSLDGDRDWRTACPRLFAEATPQKQLAAH